MLSTLGLAIVMFVATNADDLVLLTLFFAQPGCRGRDVFIGQLAGMAVLTGVSYAISLLAVAVPPEWIPWLGMFPLYLGFRWLFPSQEEETAPAGTSWWMIAGVTLANGADNLGVYIPAFAIQAPWERWVTVAAFLVLTLVWTAAGWSVVRHPTWGAWIRRLSPRLAPYVLIGVGLWILAHHPWVGWGK